MWNWKHLPIFCLTSSKILKIQPHMSTKTNWPWRYQYIAETNGCLSWRKYCLSGSLSFGRLAFDRTFYQLMFPHGRRMFYLHWQQDVCTCENHSYRKMFDLPTCVSCPSAPDEGWKNKENMKRLNWCYLWTVEAIHFLQQFRAVFQNPHFIDTCATVYDWWQVWQVPFDDR